MDNLSATFSALADPTRRAILARLALGEATVTDLAAPFDMSLPAVTKHLKVLERARLISRGRSAQWRPAKLEAAPLRDVSDWVGQYRRMWEERFDRLEAYLQELKSQPAADPKLPKHSKRAASAAGKRKQHKEKPHARKP